MDENLISVSQSASKLTLKQRKKEKQEMKIIPQTSIDLNTSISSTIDVTCYAQVIDYLYTFISLYYLSIIHTHSTYSYIHYMAHHT